MDVEAIDANVGDDFTDQPDEFVGVFPTCDGASIASVFDACRGALSEALVAASGPEMLDSLGQESLDFHHGLGPLAGDGWRSRDRENSYRPRSSAL